MSVCKAIDEYIEDKDVAIWMVDLSNGERIYEDDERDGPEDKAWLRLKKYCEENFLKITTVWIKFRSHTEKVMDNTGKGVFFRRGVLGSLAGTTKYYLFGLVDTTGIHVWHWRVPELLLEEEDDRAIENCEATIIWNPNVIEFL